MKELIINNLGLIGVVLGFIVVVLFVITAEEYHHNKWHELAFSMLVICAIVGFADIFKSTIEWLLK